MISQVSLGNRQAQLPSEGLACYHLVFPAGGEIVTMRGFWPCPNSLPGLDTLSRSGVPGAGALMSDQNNHFLASSLNCLQENVRRSGPAAAAGYTLTGAILLLGGFGHLFDRWVTTSPWGLVAGLLLGLIVGFYELAKTIWKA